MTRDHPSTLRLTAVVAVAAILFAACDDTDGASPTSSAPADATVTTVDTVAPTTTAAVVTETSVAEADEPPPVQSTGTPEVRQAAAARQSLSRAQIQSVQMVRATGRAAGEPSDEQIVREWIVALTALERALDADAIRSLGDNPALERIAGPVDDLDASTQRVIELLDPASGAPDYLGALVEAQTAIERWQAAVPDVEAAWAEVAGEWETEWAAAVAEWETEWAAAVVEWETEWAAAVAEWETEWAAAVAEWEAEWAAAVAEWETEWAAAVAEWESEWATAVAEWEAEWAEAVAEWQEAAGERRADP